MRTFNRSYAVLLLLIPLGCDDGFDPKGKFEESLAVYAVLRSTTDSQFVRVHAAYDPPAFDPLEHTNEPDLRSASVLLRSDSGTIVLADTLVEHPDQRYGPTMRVYYLAPFVPQRGLPYTLTVTVPDLPTASSTTIVPRSPLEFRLTNTAILSSPRLYESQDINMVFKAPPEAYGFLARFYIEYEVRTANPYIEQREIPIGLVETESEITPRYPELAPLASSVTSPFEVLTFWSFQTEAYRYVLSDIVDTHGLSNLRFRRVIVYLYQVDESVYKYYNIANGFRDEFSIRTDLPDFTNISGGVGVFGSVALDSLSITVSPTLQF